MATAKQKIDRLRKEASPEEKKLLDYLYEAGVEEGRQQMKKRALDFLQDQYMKPSVTRNSPEGLAILGVAQDLSKFL